MDLGCVGSLFAKLELRDHTVEGRQKARISFSALGSAIMPIGTLLTGVGAAFMLADKRARELGETLGQVAVSTNISKKALRDMMLELADVDFVLNDVTAGMQALTREGVKNEEAMENNLKAYDLVSDALELTMSNAVERLGGALQLFGYRIDDIAAKQDVFAYVFQTSSGGLDEFLSSLERLGMEIEESSMSLEQYTSIYLILEERGFRGRAGIKAMREAMNETQREMAELAEKAGMSAYEFEKSEGYALQYFTTLTENLDITTAELKKHADGIDEATGATIRLDQVHEESHSQWDRLKFAIDRARFTLGEFLEPISFLGPALTSLGPVMMSVSMASQVWGAINLGVVAPSLTAITIAGLPLWLILGAIAAAVLALIVVFKNWDKISAWFSRQLDRISKGFSNLWQGITSFAAGVKEKFKRIGESIGSGLESAAERIGGWRGILEIGLLGPLAILKRAWDKNWGGIRDTLRNVFDDAKRIVSSSISAIKEATIGRVEDVLNFMKGLPERMYKTIKDAMQKVVDAIRDKYEEIKSAISGVIDRINPLNWDIPGLSPFLTAFEHAGELASSQFYEGLQRQARKVSMAAPTLQVTVPRGFAGTGGESRAVVQELKGLRKSMEDQGTKEITIHVDNLEVRNDQDVKRIATELKNLLQKERTAKRGS